MEAIVTPTERILKAAAYTDVKKLSNAISSWYEKDNVTPIVIRAIGAGAINQAVKGIITSGQYFSQKGMVVMTTQSFKTLNEADRNSTAIEFSLHFKKITV